MFGEDAFWVKLDPLGCKLYAAVLDSISLKTDRAE